MGFLGFLSSIGARAWGYMAAAGAVVVGAMLALGRAKQAGRNEVATKVNQSSGEAAARMAEAATQAPKDKDDVVKGLRTGDF